MSTLRIAFLHLAPCLRDVPANRRLIDRAVTTAATTGATWILTPELCICGYDFTDLQGEIDTGAQDLRNMTNTYSANGLLTWYLERWRQTLGLLLEGRYETFRSVDLLPETRGLPAREDPSSSALTSLQRSRMRSVCSRTACRCAPCFATNWCTVTLGLIRRLVSSVLILCGMPRRTL
jgi:hypothetical protein